MGSLRVWALLSPMAEHPPPSGPRLSRLRAWWKSADSSLTVHRWLLWLWVVLAIPSVLWWSNSVAWLVIVSVYANIAGHWAAVQSAVVEKKQEEAHE